MFNEEEVQGNSPYASFKPNEELEIGDSFCIFIKENTTANSAEYGEFTVVNGVVFDCSSADEAAMKKSMQLKGFIPNTLLLNKIASGLMRIGGVYRIEKTWNRGDKYNGNMKAKGFGYKLFKLGASDALLNVFEAFIAETLGTSAASMTEEEAEEAPKVNV